MISKRVVLVCVLILSLASYDAFAGSSAFYKDFNLIGGYSHRKGWLAKQKHGLKNSVGFEYLQKFSSEYGDFLTLDFQARLAYDPHQPFDKAWSIEFHEAWLETKLGLGNNIRVGHFAPAFGLEPVVDTHGTLLQTLARRDIGFKKDWGVAWRGILNNFDYILAMSLGSGMGFERKDGSYLITGRIGSAQTESFQYGFSAMIGEVLKSTSTSTFPRGKYADEAILKKRAGFDLQYFFGPYVFKGEYALGWDDSNSVTGAMAEVDYRVPFLQALELKLQGQLWAHDLTDADTVDSTIIVGASYELWQNLALRCAYFHDLHAYRKRKDRQVYLQLYFFG